MAIALIQDWFSLGCPYQKGVDIYLQVGTNQTLASLFKKGENAFTKQKLKDELKKFLEEKKVAAAPPPKEGKQQVKELIPDLPESNPPTKQLRYDTSSFPKDLRELDTLKGKLYARAAFLKSKLATWPQADRADALMEIKQIMRDEVPNIWRQLDYYHETGERLTQEKEENPETTLHELTRLRNNARTKVSRYKAMKGKEHLLAKWEAKKQRLEYQIENFSS